jgi:class 3 adenylate cyclase
MSFAIRTVTLMFTDVKSSTAMYEKLGDSQAFELVKKHFAIMEDELRNYEGGVVKTIGDSVMASFPDNLNAVKCAIAIQRAIKKQAEPLSGLQVRIGLHRGYAIAVTSNRNLDFFGSTVNTAARVESKADAGEVVCSEDVLCDAEVSKWFEEQKISLRSFKAELKGLSKDFTLFCCTP